MKALLVLALASLIIVARATQYEGFKVVRASLVDEKQIAVINSWGLDVWTRESALGIGLNVNDEHIRELAKLQVSYQILINDLDAHLEEGHREHEESRTNAPLDDFFVAYHTYDEIAAYLTNLSSVYSGIAKFIPSIGKSIEGRDLFGITITGTATGPKNKIFISGGQHAREWISPATVLYIITQLITQYDSNGDVKRILDSTEFDFIPLVNPDGYSYTWLGTAQRLWRKNRRVNIGGTYGVDLNRNWNDHWGGEGSSGTPSSDTYRGTAPFSEPETTAVSNFVLNNGKYVGAIDYHSYSQLILRPYGWTTALPPNDAEAKTVGDTIRARILSVNNVAYTSQASWQLYYTAGTAQDWYYSEGEVPLSYTIELRDTGTYGFQLPPAQIKPTGQENWVAFIYFAQVAGPSM